MLLSLRTHLYVVKILLTESLQGYVAHKYLAIGMLNNLSDTLVTQHKEVADKLRDIRIHILEDVPSALTILDAYITQDITTTILAPFTPMQREYCYDCCIKHISTALTYFLADNVDAAIANLIEAYNEAPDSKDDFIKNTIMDMLENPRIIDISAFGLLEFLNEERLNNGV